MTNWYLVLVGKLTAATVGRLDNYSPEHQRFLSSGYNCPSCEHTLMRWWGVSNVLCLAADGKRVPVAIARLKGDMFQCPNCLHRWKFRSV